MAKKKDNQTMTAEQTAIETTPEVQSEVAATPVSNELLGELMDYLDNESETIDEDGMIIDNSNVDDNWEESVLDIEQEFKELEETIPTDELPEGTDEVIEVTDEILIDFNAQLEAAGLDDETLSLIDSENKEYEHQRTERNLAIDAMLFEDDSVEPADDDLEDNAPTEETNDEQEEITEESEESDETE